MWNFLGILCAKNYWNRFNFYRVIQKLKGRETFLRHILRHLETYWDMVLSLSQCITLVRWHHRALLKATCLDLIVNLLTAQNNDNASNCRYFSRKAITSQQSEQASHHGAIQQPFVLHWFVLRVLFSWYDVINLGHWFKSWGKLPKLGNGAFWFG